MAATAGARSDFISAVRQAADKLMDAVDSLNGLKAMWDYGMSSWIVDASGNDPEAEGYDPGDFVGNNQGLMVADVAAVVGTTLTAVNTLLAAGHGTNLQKVRP